MDPVEGELDVQEVDEREVPEGGEGDDEAEAPAEGVDTEGEEGDAEQVDAQAPRRPSRAQSRIQTLTNSLKEEKAERQRIDREIADLRAAERARQQQTQQESPEARAQRRALQDPMLNMQEDLRESEARTHNLLREQALQTQETQDKLLYNSILRDAPHLKRYDAEVEKIRLEQAANGVFVPREVLLDLAIGRAARAAAMKAAPKAKAAGAARIAAQQSRPAAARGDAASQRGKQGDSAEKRLENVPI
jgi:hypothetical protein